jgi:hypothetical protein
MEKEVGHDRAVETEDEGDHGEGEDRERIPAVEVQRVGTIHRIRRIGSRPV